MFSLKNNEYMIMALIWESKTASGYGISVIISNRGYRQWANIGMTSIYGTLKKLEKKGLISSRIITEKSTRGPASREYVLTESGSTLLIEETKKGLSETRERDRRFDLALSIADILHLNNALELIKKRKVYLDEEYNHLDEIYNPQKQDISFTGALVFRHTLNFIRSEIKFLEEIINQWEEITHGN